MFEDVETHGISHSDNDPHSCDFHIYVGLQYYRAPKIKKM